MGIVTDIGQSHLTRINCLELFRNGGVRHAIVRKEFAVAYQDGARLDTISISYFEGEF